MPSAYTGSHAIFICYDITNYQSFQNAEDWVRQGSRRQGIFGGVCGIGRGVEIVLAGLLCRLHVMHAHTDECKTPTQADGLIGQMFHEHDRPDVSRTW